MTFHGLITLAIFVALGWGAFKFLSKTQVVTAKSPVVAPPPDGSKPQYSFFMFSGAVSDVQYTNVNGSDGKVLRTNMKFFIVGDMALPFTYPAKELGLIDGWKVALIQATNLNTKKKLPIRMFVTSHQVWEDIEPNMQEIARGAFGGVARLKDELAQYGLNQKLVASSEPYSPAG